MLVDMMYIMNVYRKDHTRMTRVGQAVELPGVTTLRYTAPRERVLFAEMRNANPFFHLMESIWIIAGREDVEFIGYFLNNIKLYSDDGIKFNASYGNRMRSHFGMDQLTEVVKHLENSFRSRQAVIQLWDPNDINKDTKDRACNLNLVFSIPEGKVNLTVFNRSNDVWFGAVGANAVQFSQIQEVVAIAMGLEMGDYYQVSNNMHMYLELYPQANYAMEVPVRVKDNRYATESLKPYRLNTECNLTGLAWIDEFTRCCNEFCDDPFGDRVYPLAYFNDVIVPMAMAFKHHKEHNLIEEIHSMNRVKADDWRIAGKEWLNRRLAAKRAKLNDGTTGSES